jgi:hypothetical protein
MKILSVFPRKTSMSYEKRLMVTYTCEQLTTYLLTTFYSRSKVKVGFEKIQKLEKSNSFYICQADRTKSVHVQDLKHTKHTWLMHVNMRQTNYFIGSFKHTC